MRWEMKTSGRTWSSTMKDESYNLLKADVTMIVQNETLNHSRRITTDSSLKHIDK